MSDSFQSHNKINLEHLQKEAKKLLRQCRAGDGGAIARMRAQLPRLARAGVPDVASLIKLADVQHALAREHGYESWGDMKKADSPIQQFLAAVRSGSLAAAKRLLPQLPDLARDSIHVACAIGDADAVAHQLAQDPSRATTEEGGWPPLMYACGSPLARLSSRHAAGILQCATLLLDRGVDPNTFTLTDPSDPESKLPALLRSSISGNIPLFWMLFQRGASPAGLVAAVARRARDGGAMMEAFKSAFSSSEMRERAMKTLASLKDRVPPPQFSFPYTNYYNLYANVTAQDRESARENMSVFLKHGLRVGNEASGPEAETPLHRIAVSGDPYGTGATILSQGADPNVARADGRTPYVLAVRHGNSAVAGLLRVHGARVEGVGPVDEFIGACLRADADAARSILKSDPRLPQKMTSEDREILAQAAGRNRLDSVRVMAQLGLDLGTTGESGATMLHVAAWHGHVEMVRLLLQHGVPVDTRDTTYGSSALGWAAHGSVNCRQADEDYCAIVRLLLDAGAKREASVNSRGVAPEDICSPAVAALLMERWKEQ
jgi:ankyrin repeat protein